MSTLAPVSSVVLRAYLSNFTHLYPEIEIWCEKVELDLLSGQRSAFGAVGCDGRLSALAIVRHGSAAKLCHISVAGRRRRAGVGVALLSAALHELSARGARSVWVTTGESVLRSHGSFFAGGGFTPIDWQLNRYRHGQSEVVWTQEMHEGVLAEKPTPDACSRISKLMFVDAAHETRAALARSTASRLDTLIVSRPCPATSRHLRDPRGTKRVQPNANRAELMLNRHHHR